jgi:hypothetical protein
MLSPSAGSSHRNSESCHTRETGAIESSSTLSKKPTYSPPSKTASSLAPSDFPNGEAYAEYLMSKPARPLPSQHPALQSYDLWDPQYHYLVTQPSSLSSSEPRGEENRFEESERLLIECFKAQDMVEASKEPFGPRNAMMDAVIEGKIKISDRKFELWREEFFKVKKAERKGTCIEEALMKGDITSMDE